MKVSIIGLGHIGGSIALNLREHGFAEYIYGYDSNGNNLEEASKLGLIDEQVLPEVAVGIADLCVLAVPVDHIKSQLPYLLNFAHGNSIITDVGSTKGNICNTVEGHEKRNQFVAAHPIAGREFSGPSSAVQGLFEDKKTIICDRHRSNSEAVDKVIQMYEALGMDILFMESEEHDIHLAYISHVSHISSFSLALSVLKAEKDEKRIFQFAGSGFDSTARLAKSSPQMWAPIFTENKEPLLKVLDEYIDILNGFRNDIINNNSAGLIDSMKEANEIRRILEGNFKSNKNIELKEQL